MKLGCVPGVSHIIRFGLSLVIGVATLTFDLIDHTSKNVINHILMYQNLQNPLWHRFSLDVPCPHLVTWKPDVWCT